jgi:hypothetical protein
MKGIVAMVMAVIFVTGLASFSFAAGLEKCVMCHKGEKSVEKIVEKSKIVTAADLKKAVREGQTAGVHKSLTDEDLKEAAAALKLK